VSRVRKGFCLSDQISHWTLHCIGTEKGILYVLGVGALFIRSCFCLPTCGPLLRGGNKRFLNPPRITVLYLQSLFCTYARQTMTAVSAPGKVLLAGGYLVLDRAYTGLVFGLSARIHVVVRDSDSTATEPSQPEIVVQSPQFRDASWAYSFQAAADDGGVDVIQTPG
jgi:hypothetical protein